MKRRTPPSSDATGQADGRASAHGIRATLLRYGAYAVVRLESAAHGTWLAAPRPGRRATIALRPVPGYAPLELLYPREWTPERLVAFINGRKEFDTYLGRVLAAAPGLEKGIAIPDRLLLATRDEPWHVDRVPAAMLAGAMLELDREGRPVSHRLRARGGVTTLLAAPGLTLLAGPGDHPVEEAHLLRCWLRLLAGEEIPRFVAADPAMAFLDSDGRMVSFPRAGDAISVTDTSSRWASMTRRGGTFHLRVNWRALLLPRPLFRHLVFHELAHTQAMDHGARFRAVLRAYSPNERALERELDAAWQSLPLWARGKAYKI